MKRESFYNALAAIWLAGVMALFYVRFTAAFYEANRAAITALLRRIL